MRPPPTPPAPPTARLLDPAWGRVAAFATVLIIATIAAYHNTLAAPFVYDDKPSIVANPTLHSWWPPWPAFSPPGGGITVEGRPLLNFSFALNYAISRLRPGGFRATNILIHICAGLALFGVVRRTLLLATWQTRFARSALALAAASAWIWTLHPLQTEAVTYIVQRAESLVGLLLFLTLYCFIRSTSSIHPRCCLAGSIAACFLGMAVKETMAAAPLLVFLYDRAFVGGSWRAVWSRRRGYYIALASTWGLLTLLVWHAGGNRGGSRGFGLGISWGQYELTQFPVIVQYLKLAVWPHPLVFEYGPLWIHRLSEVVIPVLTVAVLLAGSLYALVRNSPLGFLAAVFWPSWLPPRYCRAASHRRADFAKTIAAAGATSPGID